MSRSNKIDDSKVKALMHRIGLKYNLQDEVINTIINSQYKFIRETIRELNTEGIETKEDFDKLKTNFILPYIGKLHISYYMFKGIKERISKMNIKLNTVENDVE